MLLTRRAEAVERWLNRARLTYAAFLLVVTTWITLGLQNQGPAGSPSFKYAAMIFAQFAILTPISIAVCDLSVLSLRALLRRPPPMKRVASILGQDASLYLLTWVAVMLVLASF